MKKIALLTVILISGCVVRTDAMVNTVRVCTDNTPFYSFYGSKTTDNYLSKDTKVQYLEFISPRYRVKTPSNTYGFLEQEDICKIK